VEDLLAADRRLEVDAVRLYQEAAAHARRMRDTESATLLEDILGEELSHVQALDGMLAGQGQHG
jgi:bacterioferritin